MDNPMMLCIDIDDTLLSFAPGYAGKHDTGSLAGVLRAAAVELSGWSPEAADAEIRGVTQRISWWSWGDFLAPLRLSEAEFWEYAYRYEQQYLLPAEPGLPEELARLKRAGMRLCVTSNNPQDGIRHKLRLAGVPEALFHDRYGATRMRAMKRDPGFWRKVLKVSGRSAGELATVGDDFEDDCRVPASVGIARSFLLNRNGRNTGNRHPGMKLINGFAEVC